MNSPIRAALADSIAEPHAVGQRVFAAVGNLHKIGDALQALMAQRGYRVERVAYNHKPQETPP